MAMNVLYLSDERTPVMTADAFRLRLQQSGFAVQSERADADSVELDVDTVVLWLLLENGFIAEIEGQVRVADDRRSNRLLELIESMGWLPAEE